jgi:hypothetical protein
MIYFLGIIGFAVCGFIATEIAIRRDDFREGVWRQENGRPLNARWPKSMRDGWTSSFWNRSNTDQAKFERAKRDAE